MNKYNDYKEMVVYPEKVEKQYVFFGYKNGKAKQFSTSKEAYEFSKNNEKVCINQEEVDAYWKAMRNADAAVESLWLKDLRDEFDWLSEKHFELCYNKAYDRGHSYGMDEVANYMCDIAYFAQQILDTADK